MGVGVLASPLAGRAILDRSAMVISTAGCRTLADLRVGGLAVARDLETSTRLWGKLAFGRKVGRRIGRRLLRSS